MLTKDQIKQIATQYSTRTSASLAEELGVTKFVVQQVAARIRKAGYPLPIKNKIGVLKQAIEELNAGL